MVIYSIKDLENISGLKAHTLRVWEKRYKIILPKRTKTNIRYYTDEDLRHLLNICFLYKKGYKISKIAELTDEKLKEKVSNYSNLDLDFKDQLDALMLFIMELDSYNFGKILDQHITQKGLEQTMLDVIYPLLDKLSMAWLAGSFLSIHESFVIQIIKSKILHSIELLKDSNKFEPTYIIYLPPGESQELSLLYLHYLLKKKSCKVINLGAGVHLKDLAFAIDSRRPDFVFTILNEDIPSMSIQNYVEQLSHGNEKTKFLLTGYQTIAKKITWPENVTVVKDLKETIAFIDENLK